jgi:hypothetical protein
VKIAMPSKTSVVLALARPPPNHTQQSWQAPIKQNPALPSRGLALAIELELSYVVASLERGRKEALAFLRLNRRR